MRKAIRPSAAGCILWLVSRALIAAPAGVDAYPETSDPCRHHLHALVAYLKETAALEDKRLSAEWREDGSVVIRCSDFSQYMWCEDHELHIRFGDPIPMD